MIGRAASPIPWIFRQIDEYIAHRPYHRPARRDRYEMMRRYY